MKAIKILILLLAFFLCLPNVSLSQDVEEKFKSMREKEIVAFCIGLFKKQEYYRSITEALRYIELFPEGEHVERMKKLIGDAYLMAGEWDQASGAYDGFLSEFPVSRLTCQVTFNKAICLLEQNKFEEARALFSRITTCTDEELASKSVLWEINLLIQQNQVDKVHELINDERIKRLIGTKRDDVTTLASKRGSVQYKSPQVAGVMSAVVPGSGQVYNGRYKDGVYSFLINGLFIWGASTAYNDENYALAGILTLFEMGWYSGNIYSAVNGAHKYNRKVNEDFFRYGAHRFDIKENEIGTLNGVTVKFTIHF